MERERERGEGGTTLFMVPTTYIEINSPEMKTPQDTLTMSLHVLSVAKFVATLRFHWSTSSPGAPVPLSTDIHPLEKLWKEEALKLAFIVRYTVQGGDTMS